MGAEGSSVDGGAGIASQMRRNLIIFKQYDAELYEQWGEALERSVEPDELDRRSRAVLRVALDSVVHWSLADIEANIDDAFEAGSNVAEMLEIVMHVGSLEGGTHGIHDGLEGLEMVVRARDASGMPAPRTGQGLGPNDMTPEAPWPVPGVFPMHTPYPRYHQQVIEKYDPVLFEAWETWNRARFSSRRELTRRMQELAVTAVDVAIIWPAPLLDHHMHAAMELGVTAQELVETVLFSATAPQGATDSNLSAHVPGGFLSLHHGINALNRVLSERDSAQVLARRDRNSPTDDRPPAFTV